MSLYGVMRTGASGMNAQANRLSTVADNIANVNTTGYKAASCQFSTLLLSNSGNDYECGSVQTKVRYHIGAQGGTTSTSSSTDLAISGNGFFVVSDGDGTSYLTRAGAFIPDSDGDLVNAAGFTLLGYRVDPAAPQNLGDLLPVNVSNTALTATPSSGGRLRTNLPFAATEVALGDLPSGNAANAQFTAKTSLIVFDSVGSEVKLDVYYSKTAAGTWEMSVFDSREASPGGGFPYAAGPLATETLNFGPDGRFVTGQADQITFTIPGGISFTADVSGTTQLATNFTVLSATANGSPAGRPEKIEFAKDGFVYAVSQSGTRVPVFRIPLGQVTSPDNLTPLPGNVFSASATSGVVNIGFSQSDGLGDILSGALEQSTVDLAGELTSMIDAQRSYTANSKVFQTGSELMDVLVNLKR
jgi:flagellar hook protein FlgE